MTASYCSVLTRKSPRSPSAGNVDHIPAFSECGGEPVGQQRLIFDDQDSHSRTAVILLHRPSVAHREDDGKVPVAPRRRASR